MRRSRVVALAGLAVLALVAAAGYLARAPLATALAARLAQAHLAGDALAALPDGLHVGICGAGSPFPDERRGGPCTLVVAGRHQFVFDAGSGSARRLSAMGFDAGRTDAVFLTHLHSDHIDGLGELLLQRWVAGSRAEPTPLVGPAGVEALAEGLGRAYAADRGWRVAHHGPAAVPPSGAGAAARPFAPGADGRAVVWHADGVEIVAFAVDHAPVEPAFGYRIGYRGRSVVISGDTRPSAAVRREARGADLLVHEALSTTLMGALHEAALAAGRDKLAKLFADIVDYHSTPEQAAAIARDAGVRALVLNHVVPALPLPGLEAAFVGDAAEIYPGPLRVAADGDFVSLAAGGGEPVFSRRP